MTVDGMYLICLYILIVSSTLVCKYKCSKVWGRIEVTYTNGSIELGNEYIGNKMNMSIHSYCKKIPKQLLNIQHGFSGQNYNNAPCRLKGDQLLTVTSSLSDRVSTI